MANKDIMKCASLVIRKYQIQTLMGYYFICSKMAEIEMTSVTQVDNDMKK